MRPVNAIKQFLQPTLDEPSDRIPVPGDQVRLLERPDGYLSQHYPLTVGGVYEVVGYMGSCLVTTTDAPNETASCWAGRFGLAHP